MEGVVRTATAVRDAALAYLSGSGPTGDAAEHVMVANAALTPRPLTVVIPGQGGAATVTSDGVEVPAQATEEGLLVHDPGRTVPGLGWLHLSLSSAREAAGSGVPPAGCVIAAEVREAGYVLENKLLRVEIGADGTLHRVIDKTADNRDVLDGRGNVLWAFVDKPRIFDAWDIEENYENEGEEILGVEAIEVVETGPLRGAVRVRRTWRDSRIEQTYRLLGGSRRVDIATRIDWHERQVYLQARFPLAVRSHEATYETLYGVVHRPTHRNTSWDAARYEVSGHRFADISEPGYGVALLNDAKYGYSAHGNTLTLSLLRGPLYPDPGADEGAHAFTYSLFPHPGDWTAGHVVEEAFALNSPLIAVPVTTGDRSDEAAAGFLAIDELPLALGSLKQAEDGDDLVVRLYEPHGNRGRTTLRFSRPLQRVTRVNLLEEPAEGLSPVLSGDGLRVQLDVRPFEIISLRVTPVR
jgi:alpha-mannosidase